jgi:hypothetical protein
MNRKAGSLTESAAKATPAYMPGARRFDVGEKCTPTVLSGAIAALEQIKKWGVARKKYLYQPTG